MSIVRYTQVFSDRKATSLKSTAQMLYSVHMVLLKCSPMFLQRLIENVHTVVRFLPMTKEEEWSETCA